MAPTGATPPRGSPAELERPVRPLHRLELRPLEWDTAFFGRRMGTIAYVGADQTEPSTESVIRHEELAIELEHECRVLLTRAMAEQYAHLVLRAPVAEPALAWAAEHCGLRLVDVAIDSTFAISSTTLPPRGDASRVRPAVSADLPFLRDVSASAFTLSRFAVDPFFTAQEVDAFYRAWISNLCARDAQQILIGEQDGDPAGFVACTLHGEEGRIQLIASRAASRRRGIGRGLVAAALHWFADAGARAVHVKTQAHNYPALALYHRLGFVVSQSELTFSIALQLSQMPEQTPSFDAAR